MSTLDDPRLDAEIEAENERIEFKHESHDERLDPDCTLCDQLMQEAYHEFYYGPVYTKAELDEMKADLPLMRDEFHVR